MTSSACPSKSEIQQVFNRLRSVQANKVCFDCHTKNPTWSSVTYGIFICIDCSGIHRSLGVHLTFVRSTQLDSNWTWQQIRQMQMGGNANAVTFFRQHNCMSSDAQQKYKSRAAQLYRDKLHQLAAQAMRLHGTKLFIDVAQNVPEPEAAEGGDADGKDFFEAAVEDTISDGTASSVSQRSGADMQGSCFFSSIAITKNGSDLSDQGPSVEAALSMSPTQALQKQEPRKSTIGTRKPVAKKGLGGAKKGGLGGGLGAQKVKKDFAEIEREAEMADQVRSRSEEERKEGEKRSVADEEKAVASMRLAYQDIGLQQKKKEEKLRTIDPKKAAQMERLGMGVGAKSGSITHSAITEMSAIEQEEPRGSGASRSMYSAPKSRRDDDDFDNFGGFDREEKLEWRQSKVSDDAGFGGASSTNWEKEFEVLKTTNRTAAPSSSSRKDEWNNNFDDQPRRGGAEASGGRRLQPSSATSSGGGGEDAQKKFGGAKSISSDMYFGNESNGGPDANLTRFSGSSSISSADYFGRQETTPGSRYGSNMSAPDMDDVKESVKQGVSKVAGRLSNMASGVMTQLQDRYGY